MSDAPSDALTSDDAWRDPRARRRTLVLLGVGAAAGLIVATTAIVAPTSSAPAPPADAVALVNEVAIRQDDYLRLLAGVESDSKGVVDDAMRRRVLDRMIDEELLVQRALDLGLAQVDRRVRAELTSSLVASIVATAEERDPEPGELAAFYDEQVAFFTQPGRLHVRQVFLRVPPGADEAAVQARAEAARAALLEGRALDAVRDEFGDAPVSPIPDTLLPALKLREYVGPSALRAALQLDTGAISEPIRSGVGFHVLVMADRTPNVAPPLEEIEEQVRIEWQRRAGDRALRAYLDQLREEEDVRVLWSPEGGAASE